MFTKFKKLNDQEILKETLLSVKKEKEYTVLVLKYLVEIERRKVYADLGYHSLFTYCTKELGYTDTEAYLRVNAVRLLSAFLTIETELKNGEISLSVASLIYKTSKESKLDSMAINKIIEKSKGKSLRAAQSQLNKVSKNKKIISKTIILNEKLLRKLSKLRELYGDLTEIEVIDTLIEEKLSNLKEEKKATSKLKPTTIKKDQVTFAQKDAKGQNKDLSSIAVTTSKSQRYIPKKVKDLIDKRSNGQCEFITKDGKRCNCRTNLEYDHIKPIALGGLSTIDNLRKVCKTHNQRAAIRNLSINKMVTYLNTQPTNPPSSKKMYSSETMSMAF